MSIPNTVADTHNVGDQRISPNDFAPSLRSKIVEILANTANGCLTELGYYPGMSQKMQDLERQNAQWQSENVKLFQDNRNLSRALHLQDEQSKHTIASLEKQIQALVNEKGLLVKQNEAYLAARPSDIPYQQLLSEYHRLHAYYSAARTEIKQLREYINRIHPQEPSSPANPLSDQSFASCPNIEISIAKHFLKHDDVPTQHVTETIEFANQPATANVHETQSEGRVREALSVFSEWRSRSISHVEPPADSASPPPSYSTPSSNQTSSVSTTVVPLPAAENLACSSPVSEDPSGYPQDIPPASGPSADQPNPISPTISVPPNSPTPVAVVSRLSEQPLKRGNDDDADTEGQPSKRLRIADQIEKNPKEDEEESDDDAIEVGLDGFRLVEDCVAALMDDDDEVEGSQNCKLCVARYNMGYTPDPPQPFLRATIDQLVLHCSSEHEDAWDTLRRVS